MKMPTETYVFLFLVAALHSVILYMVLFFIRYLCLVYRLKRICACKFPAEEISCHEDHMSFLWDTTLRKYSIWTVMDKIFKKKQN